MRYVFLKRKQSICLIAATVFCCTSDNHTTTHEAIGYNDLLNACLRSNTCGLKAYPRISDCIDAYYNLYRDFSIGAIYSQIYKCINAAQGDCDAASSCFGVSRSAESCDKKYQAQCDGEKALTCDLIDKKIYGFECANANLRCNVKPDFPFEAICVGEPCDASFGRRCDGNVLITCENGSVLTQDCSSKGQICSSVPWGNCAFPKDTACDPSSFAPHCDGTVAITCRSVEKGGWVYKLDCAQQAEERTCQNGFCVVVGTECTGDDFDKCQGNQLLACLEGRWQAFDCKLLGFGPCETLEVGARCSFTY
ncbi:MAG: hypothetical protein V1754_12885 [Pseudomonadota bacterium]